MWVVRPALLRSHLLLLHHPYIRNCYAQQGAAIAPAVPCITNNCL
jgi:hypothetical protein